MYVGIEIQLLGSGLEYLVPSFPSKAPVMLEAQLLLYLTELLFINIGECGRDLRSRTICALQRSRTVVLLVVGIGCGESTSVHNCARCVMLLVMNVEDNEAAKLMAESRYDL